MRPSLSFLFAAFVAAASFYGCSDGDGDGGGSCKDYEPPASFDAQSPKVSFSKDVMPIFKQSCAFTSCHGLEGSDNGVFLGQDQAKVHQGLVDVRASELPTMAFVKAGDPRSSYLMRKIDGSQCVLDAQCVDKKCGESMPRGEGLLPVDTRDTVRRWIAQGAKND